MVAVEKAKQFFTPGEAAAFLRVSRGTIYRYLRNGKLVATRQGRRLIISRNELEWLQSPASRSGMVLREYTDEQIAQFLRDDVLTPEQAAIVQRYGLLDDPL
jgi:excisionase family DNA binding protein